AAGGAVLSALCRGRFDFRLRLGGGDVADHVAVWRAVRPVLLRHLRPDVAGAAQALELGGRRRRCDLGGGGDGGLIVRRSRCCELARAEELDSGFVLSAPRDDGYIAVTSAAARCGCTASAPSSPADRSSWPRRRTPSPR